MAEETVEQYSIYCPLSFMLDPEDLAILLVSDPVQGSSLVVYSQIPSSLEVGPIFEASLIFQQQDSPEEFQ